jgi:hypothetical protein
MVMGERVDYWLFGVWPYVAATSVLIGPIVRALAAWRSHADLQREFAASLECLWGDVCWRGGVASVLVGRADPAVSGRRLAWNSNPIRLLALEARCSPQACWRSADWPRCSCTTSIAGARVRARRTPNRR